MVRRGHLEYSLKKKVTSIIKNNEIGHYLHSQTNDKIISIFNINYSHYNYFKCTFVWTKRYARRSCYIICVSSGFFTLLYVIFLKTRRKIATCVNCKVVA